MNINDKWGCEQDNLINLYILSTDTIERNKIFNNLYPYFENFIHHCLFVKWKIFKNDKDYDDLKSAIYLNILQSLDNKKENINSYFNYFYSIATDTICKSLKKNKTYNNRICLTDAIELQQTVLSYEVNEDINDILRKNEILVKQKYCHDHDLIQFVSTFNKYIIDNQYDLTGIIEYFSKTITLCEFVTHISKLGLSPEYIMSLDENHFYKVIKRDLFGNIIARFNSVSECANFHNVKDHTITFYASQGKNRIINNEYYFETSVNLNSKTVYKLNTSKNIIVKIYESSKECSEQEKINNKTLSKRIIKGTVMNNALFTFHPDEYFSKTCYL